MGLDPTGNLSRNRGEASHLFGLAAASIKISQGRNQRVSEASPDACPQVGVGLIPDVSHRCQAVAEMGCATGDADAFCDRMADGNDEVAFGRVELASRPRVEGQQLSIMAVDPRQPIQARSKDAELIDRGGGPAGSIDQGMQLSVGEVTGERIEHAFTAAQPRDPVVDECNPQGTSRVTRD